MNESNNHPQIPGQDQPSAEELDRRRFFARLSLVLGGAAVAGLAAPAAGFVLGPLLKREQEVWRTVGEAGDFRVGETVAVRYEDVSPLPWAGVTARTAAWLRRASENEFVAFSIHCTHLGCPVRWLKDAQLFMCPCHGGVFYRDGKVAAGPPEKPLTRYPVRVREGRVQIQTAPLPLLTR